MDPADVTTGAAFVGLELLGTVAFAVSGAMAAVRARMDWAGIALLAVITAIGGGTMRDLALNRTVAWVLEPWPVLVALATASVVMLVVARRNHSRLDSGRAVVVADAAGLAVFTLTGTDLALDVGASGFAAVLLGVLTGAGGGVLRDVLVNRTPLVLVGEIYILAAAAGATLHVLLVAAGVPSVLAIWLPVLAVLGLRVAAIRRRWYLPHFDLRPH